MNSPYKKTKNIIIIPIFFLLLSFLMLFPMTINPQKMIIDDYDGILITWIMNRVQDNLLSGRNLFSGNIFYPYEFTLAFSDLFLTDSLLTLPLKLITKEPLVIYNFSQFLGLFLTAYFTFLLVSYLSKDRITGIIAGLLVSFSGFHLHYLGHLQVFNLYYLPLFLLFFHKWIEQKERKWLLFAALSFIFQTANSFFAGYLLITLVVINLFVNKNCLKTFLKHKLFTVLILIATVSILLPIMIPYINVSRNFQAVRSIREAAHFSLGIEEIFIKFRIVPILILFIVFLPKIWKRKREPMIKMLLLTAITGLILSLGPVLKWVGNTVRIPFPIPLPYAIFYYLLPGFQAFRTPSRWFILAGFALSILIALELGIWLKNKNTLFKIGICSLIVVILFIESGFPFNFKEIPEKGNYPAVYKDVKKLPEKGGILELPIYNWSNIPFSKNEAYRMLYSLDHKKNLYNGYSGYFPDLWLAEVNLLQQNFPDELTLKLLKKKNINYLVVHKEEFTILNKAWGEEWGIKLKNIENSEELKKIRSVGIDDLYQLN